MNVLIIDDNAIARSVLRKLCSQQKDIIVAGECATAVEAHNFLQEQPVDLLLLDIEMPEMNGLQLVQLLGANRPVIVFTTSKKDYASEAFDLNVADYIVKPVTPVRFLQAMDKARDIIESNREEVKWTDEEFIFIRDSTVIKRLKVDDILFAEAMGDYVKLYTPQKFYAIHTTLKAVEDRLPASRFLRVHRSFVVALNKIDTIQEGVLIIDDKPVPVADAYRKALNSRMNIL
ncbi:LytR/AlgR family response regulator transcription factor [Puia dinghuensis]|uniref:DNA-binding response regulator n=1 Tax=Puia dinghuensis TaxID=1792502 RepID=A0A8J2UD44_9BACT|nr:LytTR family DNA-binding domain-containing protein [Puia dinghuensis]GGB01297.1 DNA-binding response regulator [Puia dinghuensis]